MAVQTVGERIRIKRDERGLSQGDLAALCRPGVKGARTRGWISNFETGIQEATAGEIVELADLLGTSPGWLLLGDSHESEFVADLRGMERQLDASGQRTVLNVAAQQVEETKKRRDEILAVEEAEVLARWRAMSDRNRLILLEALRGQDQPSQDERTEN